MHLFCGALWKDTYWLPHCCLVDLVRMRYMLLSLLFFAAGVSFVRSTSSVDLDFDDNLDEDEFISRFGLKEISDPQEKARRREALKEHEEIVKRENVNYEKERRPGGPRLMSFLIYLKINLRN